MATWKKLVVSGSAISQLNNDSGYISASQVPAAVNGFATASYNGNVLIADSLTGSLNFASSSGQGLTISASTAIDTLTFGLSAIPNASLANPSVSLGGQTLTLGEAATTTLTGMVSITSTSFTGSLAGTASYAVSSSQAINSDTLGGLHASSFVLNSQTSSMSVTSASYAVNSTSASYALNATNATSASYVLNSTSASYALNTTNALTASNITPAITNAADNRVLTANGGGTINGEANLTFDGSTLILTGNQTISGDLTVNGTTTTINTDNLLVEDKFILLASGSAAPTDGGIIVQSAAGGLGNALLYDSAQTRWAFSGSVGSTVTSVAPDAFISTVLDLNVAENTDKALYQKPGNIKIAVNEDIFIWS